jgi:hypothetical protein
MLALPSCKHLARKLSNHLNYIIRPLDIDFPSLLDDHALGKTELDSVLDVGSINGQAL